MIFIRYVYAVILSTALIACGGGGGSSYTPPTPTENPPVTQPPPADFLIVEAEDFDTYYDTTTSNEGGEYRPDESVGIEASLDEGGGFNIGWTAENEWLEYTIDIPQTANYLFSARIAAEATGGMFSVSIDGGEPLAVFTLFATGDWQQWVSLQKDIGSLSQGQHTLRIDIQRGLFNVNWFRFDVGQSNPSNYLTPDNTIPAANAIAAMGYGFNIGQVFETNDGSAREFLPVKAKIDAYYALGFRTVRVPISWSLNIGGSTLFTNNETGEVDRDHPRLAVIKEVIEYALSLEDMFVIINAHHEIPIKHNRQWWVFEQLWKDIANIFQDHDHRLIFELLNEPHNVEGLAMPLIDIRTMSQLAYQQIRKVDPYRIVVISGDQWGAANELQRVWSDLKGLGEGQDPYLMATFHHYDPWLEFHSEDTPTRDYAFTDDTISSPMSRAMSWRDALGIDIPIFIGEWGVGWGKLKNTMDCNNVRKWYHDMPVAAADREMPTIVWDDGGWFASFNYEQAEFVNNLAECIVGDCQWSGADRFNAACY